MTWFDFCRECDQPVDEVSGTAPNEHCEPCGHDSGYYGRDIPVAEVEDDQ